MSQAQGIGGTISIAEPERPEHRNPFGDLLRVVASLGGLGVFGLCFVLIYAYQTSPSTYAPHVLWSLALWVAGVAVGFLFAIPEVLQREAGASPKADGGDTGVAPRDVSNTSGSSSSVVYQQRVNTNLEEISDWLTKIIVGLGLVELRQLDVHVARLGTTVASSFPDSVNSSVGVSVVLYFSVIGFLFGYLVTRLYIQGALFRAERSILSVETRADLALQLVSARTAIDTLSQISPQTPLESDHEAPPPSEAVQSELQRMCKDYQSISIPDWALRVDEKNKQAAKIAKFVLDNSVSRDWLANQKGEGHILALAATSHAVPHRGDVARILRVADSTTRLHVKYRIVLAFTRLLEAGFVSAAEKKSIEDVLQRYQKDADDSLQQLISAAQRRFGTT